MRKIKLPKFKFPQFKFRKLKRPQFKLKWKVTQRFMHIAVIATSFICLNFGFVNCSPVHDLNGAVTSASTDQGVETPTTTTMPIPTTTIPMPPGVTSTTTTSTTTTMKPGATTTTTMKPAPTTTTTTIPVSQAARYQFTCNAATTSPSQMQRLSRREYQNTIRDLLSLINPALYSAAIQADIAKLPNDQTNATVNNSVTGEYESTVLIYADHISNYFQTAYDIGGNIAANASYVQAIPGTAGCLSLTKTNTDACITSFVNGFGLKAFRRPLTTAEVTQYKGYYNSSAFASNAQKIQAVIAIFLQSPDFLYRIYDQGTVTSTHARSLNPYEYASKISYLITGSMPDETLFGKAASGALNTTDGVNTEVARLLALPAARTTIARFFKEWLQYDTMPDMTTFPSTVVNGIDTTNLATNMVNDVDHTIQSLVFDYNASYQDLVTTRISYIAGSNLAQIYGVVNPNGLVTLGAERTGIFSRAAFLAKQAQPATSPVKRGRFMLTSVLCQSIGNPPPGAPAQAPPLDPGVFYTTRDRYNLLTVQDKNGVPVSSCVGCHSRMNPLGYVYESFDPFGRVRSSEPVTSTVNGQPVTQNLPINTQAVTSELDTANVSMGSYMDLHQYLATSDKALACMSQQWFKYLEKRAPATATFDGCYMNEFLNTAYGTSTSGHMGGQGAIKDVIKKTVLSTRFKTWNN